MNQTKTRIAIIAGSVLFTLGIHYGWLLEPFFGQSHWIHAIHGRLCYVPIVVASVWFGLRGGLITAAVITAAVLPYVFDSSLAEHNFAGEVVELVFYFAIAFLSGGLVDRQNRERQKNEEIRLQLERSHRLSMIGQMAAGVAHEIKNPLASIKGAMEILADPHSTSEHRAEFTQLAANEIRRIDSTVTNFLQFGRPQATKLERHNLAEIVANVVRQLTPQAGERQIRFKLDTPTALEAKVDHQQLHQLCLNLLLNALDASTNNSEIEVTLTEAEHSIELIIRDQGEGIPAENIPRLFEPFHTTKATGTGIGLAIVKAIVESHNGTIHITSKPGEGTTVTVTLPGLKG